MSNPLLIDYTLCPPSTDDLPRFNSSINAGLRSHHLRKNCLAQVYVGKHLTAIAYLQSRFGHEAALLLEFESIHGSIKRCIVRREDFACGGKKVFACLLSRGYCYDLKHQETILNYLSGLGAGLPEILADEQDRICMDLDKIVLDVARTKVEDTDIDNIPF